MKTIRKFPCYFGRNGCLEIGKEITVKEVLDVLKCFSKYKSLGLNGWTVEFYLHFFDLLGEEITEVVEETRRPVMVLKNLNSTYITLIPKKDRLISFNDYQPISLCNMLFKIITKIIAERMNPLLGKHISKEQFDFLPNRQILDAVGITHECLHSVRLKKLNTFIQKMDLEKAYNKIDQ